MKAVLKPLSKDIEKPIIVDCENETRVTIGRKDSNDYVLNYRNVSSFHALIECFDDNFYLEDLNSTNGTFVNGEQIKGRVVLNHNDRVKFASFEFLVDIMVDKNKKVEREISSDGTVFMDASKVEEVQNVVSSIEEDNNEGFTDKENDVETGKETVLYGVKGLLQNARLVFLNENRELIGEYELKDAETTIGREDVNNIVIDHPSISRVHCFINRKDGYYEIVDSESTNGTFVNGKKIKKAVLKNGDFLKLGDKEFVFIAPGELFSPSMIERDLKKGVKGFNKKRFYIITGSIFVLLFVILLLLPSGPSTSVRNKPSISEKELRLDVKNSYKNEDWDNVVYLIDNFKLKGFEKEYNRARFEIKNREIYIKFVNALKDNNFKDACLILKNIDKNSVYRDKGEKLYREKSREYISTKLENIDSLLDENKVEEAFKIANNLADIFPENQQVLQVKDDTARKFENYMKKKQAMKRYFVLRKNLKRKAIEKEKEAKSLYLNGKVVDAITKIIDATQLYVAKNISVPSRLKGLKDNLSKVRRLYQSGKKAFMEGDTDSAARDFEEIFSISEKYLWGREGKIEKECRQLLKDYYLKKATEYYHDSNYTKALSMALKVLKIDPENTKMLSLKREILRKAKTLYNKGYIEQTQYRDCKAALFYFRQVI